MSQLLLASASPQRRNILENLGFDFRVIPAPNIDEDSVLKDSDLTPVETSICIALAKMDFLKEYEQDIILTADTIVAYDNVKLGKPCDAEDARVFLRSLSGRKHQVITAIAIRNSERRVAHSFEVTDVYFRALSEDEIEWYVRSGEPFDKAGAYAIQGLGGVLVSRIDGCYFNVVGFPIVCFLKLMESVGLRYLDFIKIRSKK